MASFSFNEVPRSPPDRVTFNADSDSVLVSPKRKRRAVTGPSKKRKNVLRPTSTTTTTIPFTSSANAESIALESNKKRNDSFQTHQDTALVDDHLFDLGSPFSVPENSDFTTSHNDSQKGRYAEDFSASQDQSTDKSSYNLFVEAVFSGETDFWQISRSIFIVNGWDEEMNLASNAYYHLQMVPVGQAKQCQCRCPVGRPGDRCFHIRFIQEYGGNEFPVNFRMAEDKNKIILFSRNVEQYEPTTTYRSILSVPGSTMLSGVKSRAVVEYLGDDAGTGTWTCSKDANALACVHIHSARAFLRQPSQTEGLEENETTETSARPVPRKVVGDFPAVSYKQIPPPRWARISSDAGLPFIPTFSQPPEFIPLTTDSSCPCAPDCRSKFSMDIEKKIQQCEVYSLTRMWKVNIEIQKCPSCKSRYIGPDCQELGLFNWNNRVLLTHDLLDDYTSSYINSETPFVAWTSVTARRYETFESPSPFLSEKRFRMIWFAYAQLLELNNDMRCSKCGPTPKVTIWDGVTLAFSKKHLTPSLRPPTTVHPTSKVRSQACHPRSPQCIDDPKLRKIIRNVLTGPHLRLLIDEDVSSDMLPMDDGPSDDDSAEDAAFKRELRALLAKRAAAEHMRSRVNQAQGAIKALNAQDSSLAKLFRRCYGIDTLARRTTVPPAYAALYMQLASEDSVLQLMTQEVIDKLNIFTYNPNLENASHLTMFPALYTVVMLELTTSDRQAVTEELLGLCRWVMTRATAVRLSASRHEDAEKDAEGTVPPQSWKKTGCLYSMPQIRHRPRYPKIPGDGGPDVGGQVKRETGCGKYYAQYGQKRLTGGIMVVWCTHGICYGFHCIPASEGRNEVFSAIYTHWEKAPEIVIYDYACSLTTYMMAREPAFFANTKCLIDHFHSMGHTACGAACKLMTYVDANPDLDKVNSSAAECGNSGILRIRKAVSYMTQEHAIIFTRVFFSIRNRLILRKQEK